QALLVSRRLIEDTKRNIGNIDEALLLHLDANLRLRGGIGRGEPGIPELLQPLALCPAEGRLVTAAADEVMRRGVQLRDARRISAERAISALVRCLAVAHAPQHRAPVHRR